MKTTLPITPVLLSSALIISISACSGGGSGSGLTPPSTPYPDPSNPSAYPTQQDDLEGVSGDNTSATAGTITVDEGTAPFNNIQYRTIYSVDDVDWIKVNLPSTIAYEFSVDNVSLNGFTRLQLYQNDGTTLLHSSIGYFTTSGGSNPRILFTPVIAGDYYLKVSGLLGSVSSYTLSAHKFIDTDSDGYSTYYDCDDTSSFYHPELEEPQDGTAGDGQDQSCTGHDWLDQTLSDRFEDADNTNSSTVTLPMMKGDPWDVIHRQEVYAQTHTIDSLNGIIDDVDYFKITVPPHTAYEVLLVETTGSFSTTVYDSNGTDEVEVKTPGIYAWLDNTVNAPGNLHATPDSDKVWYVRIEATAAGTEGVYAVGLVNYGTDADMDGAYSQYYGSSWDCDDSNPDVHGIIELAPDDGIDSNCNGRDDT